MIEVLMQVRKDKYKDNPILPEGLDLVEEEEQVTHEIQLEEDLKVEEGLSTYPFWCMNLRSINLLADIFKFDPNYVEIEEKYNGIKAEILGEGSSDEESGSEEGDSEDDDEGKFENTLLASLPKHVSAVPEKEGIEDRTETNLVNLRRVIYLTIMNALNYEEAVHKLLKVQLKEGEEVWHSYALLFSDTNWHARLNWPT
jgi:pre-mRNA-splicing factor CWC22